MRVALISANLGHIDPPAHHAPQRLPPGVDFSVHMFTSENFPPRPLAMSLRLQAKLPKLFGWRLVPDKDVYIWLDSSFEMREDAVAWLLSELGTADLALFRHHARTDVATEADHIRKRLPKNVMRTQYIKQRYAGEWLEPQQAAYRADPAFVDDKLFSAGCFAYRPVEAVRDLLQEWWWHISLYHINDQLSLPYVLSKLSKRMTVHTIRAHIYKTPQLRYLRPDH
jgi:hypothetical protein